MKDPRLSKLSEFSKEELEQELLQRQKCQFQRLHCTNQAQAWITKPLNYQRNPACFNCQQDILILSKDHA